MTDKNTRELVKILGLNLAKAYAKSLVPGEEPDYMHGWNACRGTMLNKIKKIK